METAEAAMVETAEAAMVETAEARRAMAVKVKAAKEAVKEVGSLLRGVLPAQQATAVVVAAAPAETVAVRTAAARPAARAAAVGAAGVVVGVVVEVCEADHDDPGLAVVRSAVEGWASGAIAAARQGAARRAGDSMEMVAEKGAVQEVTVLAVAAREAAAAEPVVVEGTRRIPARGYTSVAEPSQWRRWQFREWWGWDWRPLERDLPRSSACLAREGRRCRLPRAAHCTKRPGPRSCPWCGHQRRGRLPPRK